MIPQNAFYAFEFYKCCKPGWEKQFWFELFQARRNNYVGKGIVVACPHTFFSRLRKK